MITDMKNAKLFSPLQLGRTTLKNRIAMAPMSMHYEATDGTVPKQLADIFVRRAEGGVGYVVIDAVTVDHKYWYIGKTTALDKDSLVPLSPRESATRAALCSPRSFTPVPSPSARSRASSPWAPPLTPTPTAMSAERSPLTRSIR